MRDNTSISGQHRTLLFTEALHAFVVVFVVLTATLVEVLHSNAVSSDLLSFVYGGAISYAGGRAAQSRQAFVRKTDLVRDASD